VQRVIALDRGSVEGLTPARTRVGVHNGEASQVVIFVYVLAGWVGVSLLAYFLILPLLNVSARSDWLAGPSRRERSTSSRVRVPSPQRLGYSGMVLERLAEHARTVLGFESAWILVSPPGLSGPPAAVAGAGTDPDLIGRGMVTSAATAASLSAASATVHVGGQERGTICLAGAQDDRRLEQRERDLLGAVAELVGDMLGHHADHRLSLGDSEPEIRALVKALAAADGATYRHSLEVAATARAVAARLDLSAADLVEVELAALVHDVGKLRVPASVLHKPGRLNPQERRLMRNHPEWGAEMVARVPGLEAVALIVRLHHERPDGGGYPYGLSGDQIPMASRIVSACGAYGVMTKRWPHRDAIEIDAALSELRQHAGTQFDPDVVEALAACLRQPLPVAA
jgi:putative nucleotidyltransferase with HDIG domain